MKHSVIEIVLLFIIISLHLINLQGSVKIASVRWGGSYPAADGVFERIKAVLEEHPDCDMVIAPEFGLMVNTGYSFTTYVEFFGAMGEVSWFPVGAYGDRTVAILDTISILAREHHCTIIPGTLGEYRPGIPGYGGIPPNYANTAPVFYPDGEIHHIRRKAEGGRGTTYEFKSMRQDTLWLRDSTFTTFYIGICNEISRDSLYNGDRGEAEIFIYLQATMFTGSLGTMEDIQARADVSGVTGFGSSHRRPFWYMITGDACNDTPWFGTAEFFSGSNGFFYIPNLYESEPDEWVLLDSFEVTSEWVIAYLPIEGHSPVEEIAALHPVQMSISVYPNPFNSACHISVDTPQIYGEIQIDIFNIKGEKIELQKIQCSSGRTEIVWRPTKSVPSGVYIVRATTRGMTASEKVMLIK